MPVNNKNAFSTLPLWYIPSLEYFWKLSQAEVCILTDHLQYTKRSFINTSPPLITGDDKLILPVHHDHALKSIMQKKLDYSTGWKRRHCKSLYHTYHNFPYGYYYLPEIEELMNTEMRNLSDYLFSWLKKIVSWLYLSSQLRLASEFKNPSTDSGFIIQISGEIKIKNYINEPKVFDLKWVDREHLLENDLTCEYFAEFPAANIFMSHRQLSILTFLMRFGPESGLMIKQFQQLAKYMIKPAR